MQKVSTIITDLDNTLYDWVEMWYRSFGAMLNELVDKSKVSQDILEKEIRAIFQEHGTSEYAFVIETIPALQSLHPGQDLTAIYDSAIQAYREARRLTRHLYPTVFETLTQIKKRGCLVVAFTESRSYYTLRRVKSLGLDGLIDFLYSPPDHKIPDDLERWYKDDEYKLAITKQRFIPEGEYKPDAHILLQIISEIQAPKDRTIYVGDNLMKDIYMAQQVGITDVWAKYGQAQHREAYELLRKVSHWREEDVERERRIYQ
ncbi:MAG: HAD family hydrolase, partial [Chloroflexales bacterium]|nr:HAD family hydrolase [Chloroflexales bacterium]